MVMFMIFLLSIYSYLSYNMIYTYYNLKDDDTESEYYTEKINEEIQEGIDDVESKKVNQEDTEEDTNVDTEEDTEEDTDEDTEEDTNEDTDVDTEEDTDEDTDEDTYEDTYEENIIKLFDTHFKEPFEIQKKRIKIEKFKKLYETTYNISLTLRNEDIKNIIYNYYNMFNTPMRVSLRRSR